MSVEDQQWFERAMQRVVGEGLAEEQVTGVAGEKYFMDFMR